jgi:hypothetical protein
MHSLTCNIRLTNKNKINRRNNKELKVVASSKIMITAILSFVLISLIISNNNAFVIHASADSGGDSSGGSSSSGDSSGGSSSSGDSSGGSSSSGDSSNQLSKNQDGSSSPSSQQPASSGDATDTITNPTSTPTCDPATQSCGGTTPAPTDNNNPPATSPTASSSSTTTSSSSPTSQPASSSSNEATNTTAGMSTNSIPTDKNSGSSPSPRSAFASASTDCSLGSLDYYTQACACVPPVTSFCGGTDQSTPTPPSPPDQSTPTPPSPPDQSTPTPPSPGDNTPLDPCAPPVDCSTPPTTPPAPGDNSPPPGPSCGNTCEGLTPTPPSPPPGPSCGNTCEGLTPPASPPPAPIDNGNPPAPSTPAAPDNNPSPPPPPPNNNPAPTPQPVSDNPSGTIPPDINPPSVNDGPSDKAGPSTISKMVDDAKTVAVGLAGIVYHLYGPQNAINAGTAIGQGCIDFCRYIMTGGTDNPVMGVGPTDAGVPPAPSDIPTLTDGTIPQKIGQADELLKNIPPSDRSNAYDDFMKQIAAKDPSFEMTKSKLPDGTTLFVGGKGEARVFDANGNIFKGNIGPSYGQFQYQPPYGLIPIYDKLTPIK